MVLVCELVFVRPWKEVVHDPGTQARMGVYRSSELGRMVGDFLVAVLSGGYLFAGSEAGMGRSNLFCNSQMKPQSSRAMATMTLFSCLPRALSLM